MAVIVCVLWARPISYPLKAAALGIGSVVAAPHAISYDLCIMSIAVALLVRDGMSRGFLAGERAIILVSLLGLIFPVGHIPVITLRRSARPCHSTHCGRPQEPAYSIQSTHQSCSWHVQAPVDFFFSTRPFMSNPRKSRRDISGWEDRFFTERRLGLCACSAAVAYGIGLAWRLYQGQWLIYPDGTLRSTDFSYIWLRGEFAVSGGAGGILDNSAFAAARLSLFGPEASSLVHLFA